MKSKKVVPTPQTAQRRRVDVASASLLVVGIVCGVLSYWAIKHNGLDPLVLVPSVVAATTGAWNLFRYEAPRS